MTKGKGKRGRPAKVYPCTCRYCQCPDRVRAEGNICWPCFENCTPVRPRQAKPDGEE